MRFSVALLTWAHPLGNIQADTLLSTVLEPATFAPGACRTLLRSGCPWGVLRAGITPGSVLCMLSFRGLRRAAPRFAKVSADHVTLAYKPSVADVAHRWAAHLGAGVELAVVGEVVGDGVQVRPARPSLTSLHLAVLQVRSSMP